MCAGDSLNLFAEMDANGDGRVSKDEMDSYFVDITGEPEASGLFEEVWHPDVCCVLLRHCA